MYEGRSKAQPGKVFGHENMGVIEEVGEAVVSIRKGDRVALPFNIGCGFCFNCSRGFTNAYFTAIRRTRQPAKAMSAGDPTVAARRNFFAFHSPILVASSLRCGSFAGTPQAGGENGTTPVDFSKGNTAEQIIEMRRKNPKVTESRRPEEIQKVPGVMCAIDAVGCQARSDRNPEGENPVQMLTDIARLVNPTGSVRIIGAYFGADPGGANEHAKRGDYLIPLGGLWDNFRARTAEFYRQPPDAAQQGARRARLARGGASPV
jgi:glutathione-independent formaldehyde dehydrogenase